MHFPTWTPSNFSRIFIRRPPTRNRHGRQILSICFDRMTIGRVDARSHGRIRNRVVNFAFEEGAYGILSRNVPGSLLSLRYDGGQQKKRALSSRLQIEFVVKCSFIFHATSPRVAPTLQQLHGKGRHRIVESCDFPFFFFLFNFKIP